MYILSKDSFSKSKLDFYQNIKETNAHKIVPFQTIKYQTEQVFNKLQNYAVVAYNAAFDVKALNNYSMALGMGKFFSDEVEIWDLMNIALHSLCNSKNYVEFALINNFITEAGNIKSSAEAVFNYLLKGEKFTEAHTALADTEIEAQILQACFKRHKKLETDYAGPLFHHPIWKEKLKLS
jgi:DNA polymerase III epsilon subunit-like protein